MMRAELERDPACAALTALEVPARGWLAAPLAGLDGRELGLVHVFDKHGGDFSELDEELLVQLAQMGSAALERVRLYAHERRLS
jgi:GAF domain-containing protein